MKKSPFTKLILTLIGAPLYFGGGGGGQTKTQKENDKLNNQLLRQQLAAAKQQQPEPPPVTIPKAPVYAPPPSQTSADTEAAAQEFRKAAKMRKGFARSKLGAGESKPASSAGGTMVSSGTKTTLG